MDQPIGVEILFGELPIARYLMIDDATSPRLTHELVDQILGSIDPQEIDELSLSFGVGQAPNLAARTLEVISERLHAEVHDLGPSDAGSDTPSSTAT